MSSTNEVAVAGVGMHPWGKWGHNFVTYGVHAALAALSDAGIPWEDVGFVSGADTMRNGYPGYVAGATFAQALGWTGVPVTSSYGACASGAMAIEAARARILSGRCDVALVVGADTTPKGFLAPQGGERTTDPDWLRFRLLGATNPTYFGMYARRRIDLFGATVDDFTAVKLKNAKHGLNNPYARYRKAFTAEDVAASPVVADPLHLLHICATSDGGAAMVLTSMEYAKKRGLDRPVRVAAVASQSACEDSARVMWRATLMVRYPVAPSSVAPESGCGSASFAAWRNMRPSPVFCKALLSGKSPYLSSPAMGKPR